MIKPPETNFVKGSHCSYCGCKFTEQKIWPRKCFRCYNESFINPLPVVAVLVPVGSGWLIQQRNIEPKKGGWCLSGGYIEYSENWQEAAARELQEEVGLIASSKDFDLLAVETDDTGHMLISCVERIPFSENDIACFQPNSEVSAIQIVSDLSQVGLCFPFHDRILEKYIAGKNKIDRTLTRYL
jgi:8-oxo-dGTP diphosphatase